MQGAGSAVATERAALQQASEAARGSVTDFMHAYYDEHKFDAYLEFASTQDRDEYRRREEERKRAIDTAMAEHTPEGNLQANKLAIEQLKDAGAHGADRSRDYQPTLEKLEHNERDLSQAIGSAQKPGAAKEAAASLDVGASRPPALDGISPEVIAQLRTARASAASTPSETGSAPVPGTATGAARTR